MAGTNGHKEDRSVDASLRYAQAQVNKLMHVFDSGTIIHAQHEARSKKQRAASVLTQCRLILALGFPATA
jgi:hypothetical protein